MHHKRGRPRNRRAGCKLCKPWKINSAKQQDQLKPSENRLIQDDEGRPVRRHRPSRRRWCRGKEGVDHELVCMTYEEAKGKPLHPAQAGERFLVCKVCGKELEHFRNFSSERKNKPAWVTR